MGDMAEYYLSAFEWGHCEQEVTCRNCGAVGLYWEECAGMWFLHDGKHAHRCDYGIERTIQKLKEVLV